MRLDDLPTPALLLDLEVLERNLDRMQALARRLGVRLRPHVKTHKCLEIARRQRALGARGITVSTFAEADAFAKAGFDDITWALPNPLSHLDGVFALLERSTIRLVVDDRGALEGIEARAEQAGLRVHVQLKIDCGYHRAGVDPESPEAIALIGAAERSKHLVFDGILTHAGHGYHARTKEELRAIARAEREVMLELAARAKKRGHHVPEISIGSTPTMSVAENLDGITEIRPGNYVFYDAMQAALGSCAIADCAVTVLASVISHPVGADRFVVDAGALALSKDVGDGRSGMGLIFEDYPARTFAAGIQLHQLSQEHGIVIAKESGTIDGRWRVGERLRILENHSCLCAALFDHYNVVRGDEVVDLWPIHRKR